MHRKAIDNKMPRTQKEFHAATDGKPIKNSIEARIS